jgi:membrane fusion protein
LAEITASQPLQKRLFRQQSLRAHELAWQGRPALDLGLPAAFTTWASVALAAATGALIAFGSYARRVDLQGTLLPNNGLITISAPSSGEIASLTVQEGDVVERGIPLYTLDVDTTTKVGGVQQMIDEVLIAEREMFAQQIKRKTQTSEDTNKQLQQKIGNLNAQITQIGTQITTQQSFVKIVSDDYKLARGLLDRGLATRNEFNVRQQAWMESQSKLDELASNELRLHGELNDAHYQLTTLAIVTSDEIDALRAKIAEIDEKLKTGEARRAIVIPAPGSGVVTAIIGHPGQAVAAGSPMLKIVPEHASMQGHLLAPSSAIGFIQQGERVLLRYSAFPYQKFGEYVGTVVSVSHAALSVDEVQGLLSGAPPISQAGPFYRVIVEPDSQSISIYGEARALPASMQVQAYALLDRRPLYQWILSPLYDLARAAHAS